MVRDYTTLFTGDRSMLPRPFNIFGSGGDTIRRDLDSLPSPPLVTIVDTLRRTHTGDENDSAHMEKVMATLMSIIPGAIVVISHARKASQLVPEDVLDDVRGSTGLVAGVDTIIKLASNKPREKGVLLYQGRTNDGRVVLKRDPSGLWLAAEHDAQVERLLEEHPTLSQNAQAAVLSERLGISHRTAVRRIQDYVRLRS
jgi:hypothetical protein